MDDGSYQLPCPCHCASYPIGCMGALLLMKSTLLHLALRLFCSPDINFYADFRQAQCRYIRNSHRWVSAAKKLISLVIEIIPVDFFHGPDINLGNICSGQSFHIEQYFNICKELLHFIVKVRWERTVTPDADLP